MSPLPPSKPGIRISDADRDQAVAQLHQALSEGRITVTELEERVAVVYAAVYTADLHEPLADLPGNADVQPTAAAGTAGPSRLELRAGASGITRTGVWSVPAQMRVKSLMGSVMLDFSKASIEHQVIEIELALGSGSAQLLLPNDATADVDGLVATMGAVKSAVASQPRAGAPHFVVRGRTRLGSVIVRRRRKLDSIRF